MEVLGIIPARGGSKGIPGKNIRPLAGRPLIVYTFESAKAAKSLRRIVLTTDSEEITALGRKYGIEVPFLRPAELAADDTPMVAVVQHALRFLEETEGYRPHYVVLLQPTAPLRQSRHIDEAVGLLISSGADSVVSICEVPHQFHPLWVHVLDPDGRLYHFDPEGPLRYTRRQDLSPVYYRNGAIYAAKAQVIQRIGNLYGKFCMGYLMKPEDSVNVDSLLDWILAEAILLQRRKDARND